MGRRVQQSRPAHPRVTHTALDLRRSRATGSRTQIVQTIFRVRSGSAVVANLEFNTYMTTEIPKPTLLQSVEALSDRDEFKVIVSFIRDERERFFADLRQAVDSNEVMKITGSISTLSEMLEMFTSTPE